MIIVADRNIPQLDEAFPGAQLLRASEITAERVRDAELLFTRSTVKVNAALLEGSRVRFVATATIGIDHLDLPYLASRGIAWASAPGSNADSVEQWLAAMLLTLHARGALDLKTLTVGIVGVGNVGSRVERFCRALGIPLLRCDPPRQAREGGDFVPLEIVLQQADLVTLHVPLDAGTRHMISSRTLALMKPHAWLVNASRGEVVDGDALIASGRRAVLDVFEREPTPSPSLVSYCALATPHIAGHSLDGKLNGTRMVYEAACRFLGATPTWSPRLPPQAPLALGDGSDEELLLQAIRSRYRIEDDDAALRQIVASPDPAAAFRRYRENYPERRELTGAAVEVPPGRSRLRAALEALGARAH